MTNLGQIPSNMTRAGIGNIAPKSDLPGGYTEPYRSAPALERSVAPAE
jgi:hypothetical protein